jgi:hypothetical protein
MRAANFPVAGIRGHQFAACKRDNKRARMSDAIAVSGDTDKEMYFLISFQKDDNSQVFFSDLESIDKRTAHWSS